MNTFKGYINYGCLGSEKRPVFTEGNPQPSATVSDPVEYTIPDGWKLSQNAAGSLIVTAPWGWDYDPNELLEGKEAPYFAGINKDGEGFRIKLEWMEL